MKLSRTTKTTLPVMHKIIIALLFLIICGIAPVISSIAPYGKFTTQPNKVEAAVPPVLVGVPANVTVSCDSVPVAATVTATSACPGNVTIGFNQSQVPGNCSQNYVITRTWTATDQCGEQSTATQQITVRDQRAPMIIPVLPELGNYKDQDTIFSDCDNPLLLGVGDVRAMDNCDLNPTITFVDTTAFKGACTATNKYLAVLYCAWFATDACGNKSSFTVYVVLVDKKAPALSGVPSDITVDCAAIPVPPTNIKAFDNCDPNPVITFAETKQPGDCPGNYVLNRTWTATDSCGNAAFKTQKISVKDKTAPIIGNVAADLTVDLDKGELIPSPVNPTVTDNCNSNPKLSFTENRTDKNCGYVLTRTWVASDDCGNVSSKSQSISVLKTCNGFCTAPVISKAMILDAGCGKSDGSIALTVSGSGNYQYKWSGSSSTTNVASGLSNGIYTVTISDTSSIICKTVGSFTVNNAANPFVTVATKNASCGSKNGEAQLSPVALLYKWSDNGTGSSRLDLAAGNYTVTATDAQNGCATILNLTIGQESGLTVGVVVNKKPDCQQNNGSVTLTVTGGTGAYAYSWGAGNTKTNLGAGNYTVVVKDTISKCETSVQFSLTELVTGSVAITVDTLVPARCIAERNGKVRYTVVPGGAISLPLKVKVVNPQGVEVNKDSLSSGTYCIEVYDAGNCLANRVCFEILQPAALVVNAAITQKNCINGGQILLNVTGGNANYTYDWSDLSGLVNVKDRYNLNKGVFTAVITDQKGCFVSTGPLVVQDTCKTDTGCVAPILTNAIIVNSNCTANDGSITFNINGTGTYSYLWNPNVSATNSAKNISQGTYTVTVTDANNPSCSAVRSFTVGNNQAVVITKEVEAAICNKPNGYAVLKPIADVDYIWSDGGTGHERDNLLPGIYQVTATETARPQCIQVLTVTIGNEQDLDARVTINKNATCGESNGVATVNVLNGSGDYSYSWGPSNTKSNLSAGVYPVTVTDNKSGCTIVAVATINNEASNAVLQIQPVFKVNCKGDKNLTINYALTKSPGFADPDTVVIKDLQGNVVQNGNLGNGNYCIIVTDANGCVAAVAKFDVVEPDLLQVDINKLNANCTQLGTITVLTQGGNGGYIYDWADLSGANNVKDRINIPAGTYRLTVTDSKGCAVSSPALLIEKDCNNDQVTIDTIYLSTFPEVPITGCVRTNELKGNITSVSICGQPKNGKLILNGLDTCVSYVPNPGFTQGNDTMCVVICDDKGICDTTIIIVTVVPIPCAGLSVNAILKDASCKNFDGQISLFASGASDYTYKWEPNVSSTDVATNLDAGIYQVTVYDALNPACFKALSFALVNKNGPLAAVNIQNSTCDLANGRVTFSPNSYVYTWNDAFVGSQRADLKKGTYFVTISDPANLDCRNFAKVEVRTELALKLNVSTENAECKQANGKATISVLGGSGNYSYTWSKVGLSGPVVDTLRSGIYSVTVKDNNSPCSGTILFTILDNGSSAVVEVDTLIALSCTEASLGSLVYQVTKGQNFVGQETLTLYDAAGKVVPRTDIPAGDYCLVVSDSLGCIAGAACFKIVAPIPLVVSVSTVDATCTEKGKITVNILSGNPGVYQYFWSDLPGNTTTKNRTDLSSGAYQLIVVDALGCTVELKDIVVKKACGIPDTVFATTFENTPIVVCTTPKSFKGTISTSDLCGLPSHGSISVFDTCVYYVPDSTFLGIDTMCVVFCDNQGFCDTVYFIITVVPQGCLLNLSAVVTEPTCGKSDGKIVLSTTISAAHKFIWSPNVSQTNVATNLAGGTYKIRMVLDSNSNCFKDTTINLGCKQDTTGGPCKIDLSAIVKEPKCGSNDGSITIIASGPSPFKYVWEPNVSQTNVANNLGVGVYKITVISEGDTTCGKDTIIVLGCQDTTGGQCKIDLSAIVKEPKCGSNDGSITIIASGPSPFKYVWEPNVSQTNVASNLGVGVYKITVISEADTACRKDTTIALGCQDTTGGQCKIDLSAIVKEPKCGSNDGSITIIASGPSPFKYVWEPNVSQTNVANNLGVGVYKITVISEGDTTCRKDTTIALGCQDTTGGPCKIDLSAIVKEPKCGSNDGSITIIASGPSPFKYVWEPNVSQTNVANNLGVGVYKIIVISEGDTTCRKDTTIALGCQDTTGGPCKIDLSAIVKEPKCGSNDGSITIIASGPSPFKYVWEPNVSQTNVANNLGVGVYKITEISEGDTTCRKDTIIVLGCQDTTGGPCKIDLSAIVKEPKCGSNDGSITIIASGPSPFKYVWEPNVSQTNVANNLGVGVYKITVISEGDTTCRKDTTIVLGCQDTTGGQCKIDLSAIVKEPKCGSKDGSITIIASGPSPFKYVWEPNVSQTNVANNLGVGVYKITVISEADTTCRKDTTIILSCPQDTTGPCNITIVGAVVLESHCGKSDGQITLKVAGAGNIGYLWSPNVSTTNVADKLALGVYHVTVYDQKDTTCRATATLTVGNADGPKSKLDSLVAANCAAADGQAFLSPANYNYLWSDGKTGDVRKDLKAGTYQVTIVNPADTSCVDLTTIVIPSIGQLDLAVTIDKKPDCKTANGKATVSVVNGAGVYVFSWGNATKDSLTAGIYVVTVTDTQSGCSGIIQFALIDTITNNDLNVIGAENVLLNCIGDANGEVKYTIENLVQIDSVDITIEDVQGHKFVNGNLPKGEYCLIVKDKQGCYLLSKCFKVIAPKLMTLNVEVLAEKCKSKGSIELTGSGGNGAFSFNWKDLNVNPEPKDRFNLDAGYYSVTMTDFKGCSLAADSIFVDNLCKKPKLDTIRINLPNPKMDTVVCIPIIELTAPVASISVCAPPKKGKLTVTGLDTCVLYTADSTFKFGCDTMCVAICDTNGICDTTIIIICKDTSIVICNNYFPSDTLELRARSCDTLATYCTPFTVAELLNFDIKDNGLPYGNGIVGCNFDTVTFYQYKVVPGEGKFGPYQLNYWGIGKDTFAGNFLDISALKDSMNVWDPNGKWKIDTVTQNIVGGVVGKPYGNMDISQIGTTAKALLIPNIDLIAKNGGIRLTPGYHDVIFIDKQNGCSDTLRIKVVPKAYDGPLVVFVQGCDSLAMVCLGIDPVDIPKVVITDNGNPYVGPIDSCLLAPNLKGIQIKLDTGMHLIVFKNVLTGCTDSAKINVSCVYPKNTVFDTCIVERDSFKFCIDITSIAVDSIKNLCPGAADGNVTVTLEPGLNQLCFNVKGAKLGADTFCLQLCNKFTGICDTLTYRICVLPKTDTIRQDIIVGCSDTICLDTTLFKGGVGSIINLCPTLSGTNIQFDTIGSTGCIEITAESVGSDTACIVICDKTGKYCDTTIVIFNARGPVLDTIRRMVTINQTDSICLDTSELSCNTILTLKNICEPNTVDNVLFELQSSSPWCVKYTGKKIGKDTACLVLCNQVTCDTTILIVMVNIDSTKLPPIAVTDYDTTSFGKPRTIMVLMNDTINGKLTGIGIITPPTKGLVARDLSDSTKFIYTPNKNFCGRDSFSYFISNENGFDTAFVHINVLCDTFIIFNAISPNGDLINDGFTIIGIENYPGNQVDVYNRWGHRLLSEQNYSNVTAWKGDWNGKIVPDGTYFYQINLGPRGGYKIYTGYLEIRR